MLITFDESRVASDLVLQIPLVVRIQVNRRLVRRQFMAVMQFVEQHQFAEPRRAGSVVQGEQ